MEKSKTVPELVNTIMSVGSRKDSTLHSPYTECDLDVRIIQKALYHGLNYTHKWYRSNRIIEAAVVKIIKEQDDIYISWVLQRCRPTVHGVFNSAPTTLTAPEKINFTFCTQGNLPVKYCLYPDFKIDIYCWWESRGRSGYLFVGTTKLNYDKHKAKMLAKIMERVIKENFPDDDFKVEHQTIESILKYQ